MLHTWVGMFMPETLLDRNGANGHSDVSSINCGQAILYTRVHAIFLISQV